MKLQQQGLDECWLATVAMLADRPLDEVRTKALSYWTGARNWSSIIREVAYFQRFDAIEERCKNLCKYFGLPGLPINNKWGEGIQLSTGNEKPDLSGKGQITVELEYGFHSMAFEDGKIYDPGGSPIPLEWEAYLEEHKQCGKLKIIGFKIVRIEKGEE